MKNRKRRVHPNNKLYNKNEAKCELAYHTFNYAIKVYMADCLV